jgi:phosphoglycolate phosphatase-like HAD superfamily hydrolase
MVTPAIGAIVFDFDGVIVRDSEFLKDRAWDEIFKEWPGWDTSVRPVFRQSLLRVNKIGGSRFEILCDFFGVLGKSESDVAALTASYAVRFDSIVQEGILQCGVTDTDRAALAFLSKKFPLCINSATPEDALKRSVSDLGLADLFSYVYGRPSTKQENIYRAARDTGIDVPALLFVGDGPGDVAAWADTGCQFIGITNSHNGWAGKPFPLLSSIAGLPAFIAGPRA